MADTNYQPVDTGWGPDDQAEEDAMRAREGWLHRDPRPPRGTRRLAGIELDVRPAGR